MKRIISICLLLALCVSVFGACDTLTAATVMTKAEKALEDIPYTVTMSMDFECEDETLNTVFDALNLEIPVTVDGKNVCMNLSTEVMGFSTGVTMTVVDNVLYSNTTVLNQNIKVKATLSEEDYREFLRNNNADMPVSSDNFDSLTLDTVDGKQVITCTGITTDGLTAMNDFLSDALSALGAEAAVGDLTMTATVSNGLFETLALTASYTVTVNGEAHTVALTMNAAYSYEDVPSITAPEDADSYTNVSYSEIMGK